MEFKIEQIALFPPDPEAARRLLTEMGAAIWSEDHVSAVGWVNGERGSNQADLAFNYTAITGNELEVLHYTSGPNWMTGQHRVSHLGTHCTEDELADWKLFFLNRHIPIVQEVFTTHHANKLVGERRYHYCIFGTHPILGVDLKFIIRREPK